MSKAKITHVLTDTGIGGAGIHLTYLLDALGDLYDFTVVLPRGAALTARLHGAKTVEADVAGDRSFSPRDLRTFARLLDELRPDILHTHACLTARIAAKEIGLPTVISTRHRVGGAKIPSPLIPLASRFYEKTTALTVSTAPDATYSLLLDGAGSERVITIPNGVPALPRLNLEEITERRRLLDVPDDAQIVGCVGRLEREKGYDLAIRALSMLDTPAPVYLFLVGDGSERKALAALADSLQVAPRVKFLGMTDAPWRYQNLFDVALVPSRVPETTSLALSEALSLGIPVIAARSGAPAGMITDGSDGFLFTPEDPADLAAKIALLQSDPALRKKLGAAARRTWRERFSDSVMRARYRRLYDYLATVPPAERSYATMRYLFL